jgi:hypothetical protein
MENNLLLIFLRATGFEELIERKLTLIGHLKFCFAYEHEGNLLGTSLINSTVQSFI